MPTDLTENPAVEGSTYVVTFTFSDEDGNDVTPKTLLWTLTDVMGEVINSRLDVSETPTSNVVKIVLSGNDLVLSNDTDDRIYLQVNGTYDSANGSDLPFVDEATIKVENVVYPNRDD